jgi:outer membrane protein OmpA-like peptidoglycan-associated protein
MRILALCAILLCTLAAHAQKVDYTTFKTATGKAKSNYEKGRELARMANFPDALRKLDDAIAADPRFIDAWAMKAAISNSQKDYKGAEAALEAALAISESYDTDMWFSLAQTEKNQEKYDEAITHYEKFLSNGSSSEAAIKQARTNLESCRYIAKAMANPVPFDPRPLSNAINSTEFSEYLPCITADGETLIFTRREKGDEDFMISHKTGGDWSPAVRIDKINSPQNEGAQTISADGKILVFTACNRRDGLGSCDLYFSELGPGGWSTPKNMGEPVSTKHWESQPCLSADGQTLYFASGRPGGQGGQDIWVSKKEGSGWSVPVNIGSDINTPLDEAGPFFHQDNETLYFMSNGYPGMGGFDLYLTRKDEKGGWQKPQNLGYPINTQRDEGSMIVSLDGSRAMMASDRKYKNSQMKSAFNSKNPDMLARPEAETDIYEFELYEAARPKPATYVKGKVRDAFTQSPLKAQVEITDLSKNAAVSSVQTDWNGEFLLCLPSGKSYAFAVNKAKYAFYSNHFSLEKSGTFDKPFLLDIPLIPIQAGSPVATKTSASKTVVLKNVFFETASAKLLPESVAELDKLKNLLNDNPTLRIRINGHTDNVGTDSDNVSLSTGRAKAVYDYLIQKGIAAARLEYKGFGESKPVASNDTPEGRQENRRTEFELLN